MKSLEEFVKQAVAGDKKSLEIVVAKIQNDIYNLAIKMLWHPDDAKDATQDILIKIITNLGSFKHKSAFKTWVYRLASNNLINFKKKRFSNSISFDKYELQLSQGLSKKIGYTNNKAEQNLLILEAKIGCSNAMLQCLTKESRLVYIIGEILEFKSKEAAIILDITPENFRQKLSRTRKELHNFLQGNCGIINPKNKCRCYKKVDNSIKKKLIQPNKLLFAKNRKTSELIDSIDAIEKKVTLYQTNLEYITPDDLFGEFKRIIKL